MKPRKAALLAFCVIYIHTTEFFAIAAQGSFIKEDVVDCETKICIPKCCNATDYVDKRKNCIPHTTSINFDNLTVYTNDIEESGLYVRDIFNLLPGTFKNVSFRMMAFDMTVMGQNNYLTEDGIVYLETPNAYRRWVRLETKNFCIEQQLQTNGRIVPKIFIVLDMEFIPQSNAFFTTALLISCVFLLLTLIVYLLLPDLRNLCGMVLMAYVASQFGAFLFLAIIQIGDHSVMGCLGLTFSIYFFFLSSFCWMNVMSIDIWWTFRGYAKARPIHRRGETFKFLMYCLYGWGVPLVMTIGFAVINQTELSHLPWLIKPNIPRNGCFLEGGEKLLYLYVPMLILILCNWIFFLMTAFNIWRLSRGTAVLNSAAAGMPSAHRFNRHRFLVYLKLSVIMGINWILEVVSSLKPQLEIWYFTDAYNLLIGLAIFIIFVCKAKINKQLKRRFRDYRNSKGSTLSRSQNSSITLESNLSRDGTKVSSNPQYK
ncbi:G-protein coupled receptor Mth2-like [Battus philenor]|uniref:G-protein coupled receptor Mth2-like n=1 Tax=Battus philenor TaxID=42288 RepID=UPI0035CEC142